MEKANAPAIPRRQRLLAVLMAVVGVLLMVQNPGPANALWMGALLLFAWRDFFYPSPSLGLRLAQLHQHVREGRFPRDRTARWVERVAMLLLIAAIVVYFRS